MYKTEADACNTVDPRTPRYLEAMVAELLKRNGGPASFALGEIIDNVPLRYEYDPHMGRITVDFAPEPPTAAGALSQHHGKY